MIPVSAADEDVFQDFGRFFGGSDSDFSSAIALDSNNNIYITGATGSEDFPVLNAYQDLFNGSIMAFISSFSTNGALRWSTYLGGVEVGNWSSGYEIAIDGDNNVYITGRTSFPDFPLLNAFQSNYSAKYSTTFVTSFNSEGVLRWSTYLGGSNHEFPYGIAVDGNNNVYVAGSTSSMDFPTLNAFKANFTIST